MTNRFGPRRFLDVPFAIDERRRTATTDEDDHIRDMIFQVLFTEPSERVMRPTFGCALRSLVFLPAHETLAAATQVLVKSSLQRWLEREIEVNDVEVTADGERLLVDVVYTKRSTGERRKERFRGTP